MMKTMQMAMTRIRKQTIMIKVVWSTEIQICHIMIYTKLIVTLSYQYVLHIQVSVYLKKLHDQLIELKITVSLVPQPFRQ